MQSLPMDNLGGEGAKRHAPATARNREAILAILRKELPEAGIVLEVASGSGEHAVYFAGQFPELEWQPSDPDEGALASIDAWREESGNANLRTPVCLDASSPAWPISRADAVLCINMVHISPWAASEGLFAGAARLLDDGAPLILYGPYLESDVETAPSNAEFDRSLRQRNPEWGLRQLADVDALAGKCGFTRMARCAMPANNVMLVYRKG